MKPQWERRQSGSAVFYLDGSSARQACRPSGLRKGQITKGKDGFDLGKRLGFSS